MIIFFVTPIGLDEAGHDLNLLLNCTKRSFYVGGDFNLRYPLWVLIEPVFYVYYASIEVKKQVK